jgi:hypothetical protein
VRAVGPRLVVLTAEKERAVINSLPHRLQATWLLVVSIGLLGPAVVRADDVSPPRILLVIDHSGSMQPRYPTLVAAVAATLAVLPDSSSVGLVGFSHTVSAIEPLAPLDNNARHRLVRSVARITPGGGTDILAGVAQALNMLGDEGGTILLLSDGAQTGATNTAWPEATWAPIAAAHVAKAREKGIVIESLGLVLRPQDRALLERLARETGGAYLDVPSPEDLVSAFSSLAASHGRFWKRSTAGTFRVEADGEQVVQLLSADAPDGLFRIEEGREVLVQPDYRVEQAGIRITRSRLARGRYRFQPGGSGKRSDLLRPMGLTWEYPRERSIHAGRKSSLVVRARRAPESGASFETLEIVADIDFGEGAPRRISAMAGADGVVDLPIDAPARTGPVSGTFEARQDGWSFRLMPWSGSLITPPPVVVSLAAPGGQPLSLKSRGDEREVRLEFEVSVTPFIQGLELLPTTSDPRLRVLPGRFTLERQKERLTLVISRTDEGTRPDRMRIEGTIRFGLKGGELTPPVFDDGSREVEWPFRWVHLKPEILFRMASEKGSPSALVLKRGSTVRIPVSAEGVDLEGREAGIRIDSSRVPPGISIGWERDGKPVEVLGPGGAAFLSVSSALGTEPGRKEIALSALSSDSDVLLNGEFRPLGFTIGLEVGQPELVARLVDGEEHWSVLAPIEPARRPFTVELSSGDGGPLPVGARLEAVADTPIDIVARESRWSGTAKLLQGFDCTIPAQSAPFRGRIRWSPSLDGQPSGRGVELPVEIPAASIRVETAPEVIEVGRYPWWLEAIVRRLGIREQARFELIAAGPVEATGSSWSLSNPDDHGKRSARPLRPRELVSLTGPAPSELVFQARYEPTQFLPGGRLVFKVHQIDLPVPWQLWAALAVVASLLLATRLLPLGIVTDRGEVVRGRGSLRLDRILALSGMRLTLRRSPFRGLSLTRSRRNREEDLVLAGAAGEQCVLAPGQTVSVSPGGLIEVTPTDGDPRSVSILGHRRPSYMPDEQPISDSP